MISSGFKYAFTAPLSLFKDNRARFIKAFKEKVTEFKNSIMMFEGNDLIPVDSTDHDYPFKQESYFYYLFGVKEPAFYATINVETEKATLYYKPSPEIYKIWMTVLSKEQYIKKYELDTFVVDDLEGHIKSMNPSKIYVNLGVNSDSGTETQIPKFKWL